MRYNYQVRHSHTAGRESARILVWLLACLGSIAVLVILFYAVENWRGKHALDKYKQELEAKGEKFTFKELVPPQPPIDQNFATAPVIASCYESILDTSGHELKTHRADVDDRLDMPFTADDEKKVPHSADWALGTVTDLSAWQTYYRQLAAPSHLFPVPPVPKSPAADVLYALKQYNPTLDEVRAASRLPYAQFPIEYTKDNPATILLPHLAGMKRLSRLLQFRSIAELQNGQSDKALDDIELMFYLEKAVRVEPTLISQLVRIAINDLALQPVYEGLAAHRWTDAQLSTLDTDLAQLDFLADFEYSMRGERIFSTSILEYLRRNRSLDMFENTGSPDKMSHPPGKLAFYLMPSGYFYQTELFLARLDDEWVLPNVDPAQHRVYPAKVHESESAITTALKAHSFQNQLASLLFPSLVNATKRFARGQISVDLARVAIALERYRLAHGEFPDSLAALTPEFMATIPHDAINGQPLNYHHTGYGQFTLYSVGWNEADDGGKRGSKSDNNALFDTGDFVWSYPTQ